MTGTVVRSSRASLTDITELLFTSIPTDKASPDESKILRRSITSSRVARLWILTFDVLEARVLAFDE